MSYALHTSQQLTNCSVQAEFQFSINAYGGGLGGRLNTTSGAHYAWIYPENSAGGSNVLKLLRFDSYSSFVLLQQTSLAPSARMSTRSSSSSPAASSTSISTPAK